MKHLKHETNLARAKLRPLPNAELIKIFSIDSNVTRRWTQHAADRQQQRGFAAAARPANRDKLPRLDFQGDVVEAFDGAFCGLIDLADLVEANHQAIPPATWWPGLASPPASPGRSWTKPRTPARRAKPMLKVSVPL